MIFGRALFRQPRVYVYTESGEAVDVSPLSWWDTLRVKLSVFWFRFPGRRILALRYWFGQWWSS